MSYGRRGGYGPALAEIRPQNKYNATTAPTVNDDANDGYSVLSEWADVTADKAYVCLDATVGAAVWSESSSELAGMSITNDGTKTTMLAPAGDYLRIGDAGVTSHSLNTNDDTLFTGRIEVDGTAYFDNTTMFAGVTYFQNNVQFYHNKLFLFGTSGKAYMILSGAQTPDSWLFCVPPTSNAMVICEAADYLTDFGNALKTNPTIIIQSANAGAPTESLELSYGVIATGKSDLSIQPASTEALRVEDEATLAATETSLWLYDDDNGQMEQVTVGAADSGGANFKVLRIPN